MPSPTRILITGGAGFIGSHLAQRLHARGDDVVLVDDLSTGRIENIEPLLDHGDGRCRLVRCSVEQALRDDCALFDGVDQVFHLAAAVGVKLLVDDSVAMLRNNVAQTLALLDASADRDLTVLIASSSEVYGRNADLPLREDAELIYGPTTSLRFSYAMSKALDEQAALMYHHKDRLRAVIVRLFNTIGLRQVGRYGMVVPRFVDAAVKGEPLTVYGDGSQTRCFIDVRDTVRALVTLMDDATHAGELFNIGSNRELTIDQLADRVIALAGSDSEKQYVPFDQVYSPQFEDMQRRVPSVDKLRSATGFEPKYALDDTLTELIAVARADS